MYHLLIYSGADVLAKELRELQIAFAGKITECAQLKEQNQCSLEAARYFREEVLKVKRRNEDLVNELGNLNLKFTDLIDIHGAFIEVHRLCKTTIGDQERELSHYRKKGSELESTANELQTKIDCLVDSGQTKERVRRRWTEEDISFGLGIYSAGASAYRTLIKLTGPFTYPAPSTIRKWVSGVEFDEGHLKIVYNLLKSLDLNENERKCVLMVDEMGLKRMYDYDRVNDRVLKPATNVQVIMIRGLFKSWKQPIFYKYKCNVTKELILEVISKLFSVGITVVALVCDQGASNVKAMAELTSNTVNFKHPCDDSMLVHTFHDTPHMIKLLRNYFLDGGYLYGEKKYTREPIDQFHIIQKTASARNNLKLASKLTDMHLDCKNMQRQKVKYATQLFSNQISTCLKFYGDEGYIKAGDYMNVSELCLLINNWFDIFNSGSKFAGNNSIAGGYGTDLVNQNVILDEMKTFMSSARVLQRAKLNSQSQVGSESGFLPKTTLMPGQKAVLHNIDALKSIYDYLKVEYILTKRLNQDPLENLFGRIRSKAGANDHPNQMQFKCLLRSLIIGKEGFLSDDSNVEGTNEITLTGHTFRTVEEHNPTPPPKPQTGEMAEAGSEFLGSLPPEFNWDIDSDSNDNIENHMGEQALRYIGGYLIRTIKKKNPLKDLSEYVKIGGGSDFVDLVSRGGLIPIQDFFFDELVKLDNIVNTFNGDEFDYEPRYLARLKAKTLIINIDDEMIALFLRCKMYFKIRDLNRKLQNNMFAKRRKLNKFY